MHKAAALALVVALVGCGGDSNPSAPAAPVPTPTPAPNYSGTYVGVTTFNVSGLAEVRPVATVTVTHTGGTVSLGTIALGAPSNITFGPLGSAGIANDAAILVNTYQSAGCGAVTTTSRIRFAGRLMNLNISLDAQTCTDSIIVGELQR